MWRKDARRSAEMEKKKRQEQLIHGEVRRSLSSAAFFRGWTASRFLLFCLSAYVVSPRCKSTGANELQAYLEHSGERKYRSDELRLEILRGTRFAFFSLSEKGKASEKRSWQSDDEEDIDPWF